MTTAEVFRRAAEDHFLNGHLLANWVTDYVDLEESLAVGSIAQEDLAHAATYLELAGLDVADRDEFIFERPVDQWQPATLVRRRMRRWPGSTLRGLLLASAAVVRAEMLATAPAPEVRDAAAVLAAEQRLHVRHWARWVRVLGRAERTAEELRAVAHHMLPSAADMFGVAGISGADAAHRAWLEALREPLGEAGVDLDIPAASVPRRPGTDTELAAILADVRELRVGVGDGVRGLYR